MSSAVVSTSAALGRPFVFDGEAVPEVSLPSEPAGHPPIGPAQARPPQRVRRSGDLASTDPRLAHITPASRLDIRPAPEMVSSGISALDTLTGGLPRGCLTEICGSASSGRTTLLLAALAAATRRGEYCAVVDASDALDPHSAAAAGVELDHLLWVRCSDDLPQKSRAKQRTPRTSSGQETETREAYPELIEGGNNASRAGFVFDRPSSRQSDHRLEQVLRATDLLLESGGFGLIILDLGDMPTQAARRIPLTTWFRFRRAIEHTPTILLTIEQHPIAGSCSSLLLQLEVLGTQYSVLSANRSLVAQAVDAERGTTQEGQPAHARLLTGLKINAELIRSRLERKPARSITFGTKTAWAG